MTTPSTQPNSWPHWTQPEHLTVDGNDVAYRRAGTGDVLLYLHGAGLTRRWLPLHQRLSESFDIVAPEHPGFGDSPDVPGIASLDDLVLHYDGLIRRLGLDSADRLHLVGHSLGGWLAADLAVTYPDRFASLTLMAPMGLRTPETPAADPFRWSPEQADHAVFSGLAAKYADEFLASVDPLEDYIQQYAESIPFARWTWNPRYDVRLERRLQRVTAPTLVVAFEDDNFIPRALPARYAELVPGARLDILSGDGEPASHVSIIQQPDAIAERIVAHAASVTDTSGE